MAENKKSFILYSDQVSLFNQLPDEIAGKLIKHIFAYVNDENPTTSDLLLNVAFEPIKLQLKRDLKQWESERLTRSAAGKKGMQNRWHNKDNTDNNVITKDNTVIKTITNITDNVTVNVNDTVNVTVNNIGERKLKFASTLKPFTDKFGKTMLNDFYRYWTEPNKSNTKFRYELEKTWDLERRLDTWAKKDSTFTKGANFQQKPDTLKNINIDDIKY